MPTRQGRYPRSGAYQPANPQRRSAGWRTLLLLAVIVAAMVGLVAYTVLSHRVPAGGTGDGSTLPTGQRAPAFTVTDTQGNPVSLGALRGKVVVLDLFATWCGPCKLEMSELGNVHAHYNASDVVIVSIDVDGTEGQGDVAAFKADYGAQWAFCTDTDSVGGKYSVTAIPTLVIVDRAGDVAYRNVGLEGADALIARIDPLLAT